jgi:probable rRNA maturation factor
MKAGARVAVLVQDPEWTRAGIDMRVLRRAANLSLLRAQRAALSGRLTILLTDDAQLRALNEKFRGKPVSTNVLSFPSGGSGGDYLGDVAIAYGVSAREAGVAGKSLSAHVAHLAIHGVLHLLGYDHVTLREARVMEPLETAILDEMGISDPYTGARRMTAR